MSSKPEAQFPVGGAGEGGGEAGGGVRDMALLSLGNLGAKFSETSFLHFKTYLTQIGRCHL